MTPEEHAAAVAEWRRLRDDRLRSPDGWLTLVGLHWLRPGANRFGSDPANEIVLVGPDVPPVAGTLWAAGGGVTLRHADASVQGEEPLQDDVSAEPTILELGRLRMHVIRRGERLGLRVRDSGAPALKRFAGMQHFPVDPSWRVTGRLERAPREATLEIADIIGLVQREATPGTFVFERDGREWRLDALPGDEPDGLWLIFGDATNGRETHGGGRFLSTEPVAPDGRVVADFNLAYNPPCVFTPYATCPLPPPQNRLPLRITAGERRYVAPQPGASRGPG